MNSSVDELLHESATPAAVSIRELRVRRGGKVILPGVSLEVPAGRVTGLLGPSGSGKTTLLNFLGLLDAPDSGEIRVEDQRATELSENEESDLRRSSQCGGLTVPVFLDLPAPEFAPWQAPAEEWLRPIP